MAKKQSEPIEEVVDSDRRVIHGIVGKPLQVNTAVDGCVINWTTRQQTNPQTGQKFDFDGRLIDDKSAD